MGDGEQEPGRYGKPGRAPVDDRSYPRADVLRPPDIGLKVISVGKAGDAANGSQVIDNRIILLQDCTVGFGIDPRSYIRAKINEALILD